MVWPIVAAAAVKAGSDLTSAYLSSRSARKNLNAQIAWERERATNAHQWEVEDLRKAGLNPILSATGGSGASTSSITPQMPDFSGISRAGNVVSEYLNLANQSNALKIQEATENQIKAETAKTNIDAEVSKSQELLNKSEALLKTAQSNQSAKETERLSELLKQLKWDTSHFAKDNLVGRSAEDIKRYFGNSLSGNLLLILLGLQQGLYPNVYKNVPKSGGN